MSFRGEIPFIVCKVPPQCVLQFSANGERNFMKGSKGLSQHVMSIGAGENGCRRLLGRRRSRLTRPSLMQSLAL